MLNAITPVQVEDVISLLERLTEARKARAAEGKTESLDEIVDDPHRGNSLTISMLLGKKRAEN
jgi:hypothetical protein